MSSLKNNLLFATAIIFSLWFAVTGVFWVYGAALFIAYPFGLVAFFIWIFLRRDRREINIIIPVLLIIGLLISLEMLLILTGRLS